MTFDKVTEGESHYHHLEQMSIEDILTAINREDKTVADAVEKAIPQIGPLVAAIADKMLAGGRLFYIGAGTSGRLGVLDASEIPPTYGLPFDLVIGVIAGGEKAIRQPVENAEMMRGRDGWICCPTRCREGILWWGLLRAAGRLMCSGRWLPVVKTVS
jgi:N-acetylmuramic acid 6-phosphate etherase